MSDAIPGSTATGYSLSAAYDSYFSTLDYAGDTDWFAVHLTAGVGYQVWLQGADSGEGTLADPYLELYNGAGAFVAGDDDSSDGRDSFLYYTPTLSGTYYLSAEGFDALTGSYLITIADDAPGSTASGAAVPVNGSVTADIGYGLDDADWVRVTLFAGVNYQFDMLGAAGDGAAAGLTVTDPWLALRNSAGTLIDVDDDSGVGYNARLYYTPTVSGTYYLDAETAIFEAGSYQLVVNAAPVAGTLAMGSTVNDSVDFAGDTDLYSVSLAAGTTYSFALTGTTLADPFLELLDSNGEALATNDDSSGLNAFLGYTPTSSGTYYLAARASGNNATGSYSLTASAPLSGDRFEDNDTSAAPTVLGTVSGTLTESNLTVQANDSDWYRFTLAGPGRAGDAVTLSFSQSLGDVDMVLYNSTGSTVLGSSFGVGNQEQISLAGLAAGTYMVRVYGYNGASNPNYSMSVTAAPQTVTSDRFEDNDTSAAPTVLGTISGTVTQSSLTAQSNDSDWYRFTLAGTGRAGDAVNVSFTHTLGDVDVALYNGAGTALISSSAGVGNLESISLAGLAAGDYLVRVYGYGGASNPDYALSVTAAPQTVGSDRFEENDTAGAPTALGTISGTRTEANLTVQSNDADWYRFTLAGPGRTGDSVTVNFTHSQGDVDIQLYDSAGTTVLTSSAGVGNQEQVSLAGLAAGDYLLRVYGYAGASNPNYSLNIAAAPQSAAADRFEENDTAGTATDLRTISGTVTETGLTVQAGESDWYRFTLPSAGRTGDAVTVSFAHSLGDVDIQLYDSAGTALLASSAGVGNQEQVSLAGLAAGTYLVRVYGYGSASNPDYSVSVSSAPQTVAADRFEDNDTAGTATDLRTISGTVSESSLTVQSGDADWYRFTLGAAGRTGDGATVNFSQSLGDVDVQLYNSTGTTLLSSSTGTGNQEQINFAGLAAGNYLLRVYGVAAASNPAYSLTLNAAPQGGQVADRFEDNDTSATATSLRTISGTVTESSLSVQAADADWYSFTLASAGRSGDAATVNFTHAQGDVDLQLYNAAGTTLIASSAGTGNQEQVSLAGLAAGTYLLKVYGYNGAANPDYSLGITATQGAALSADPWEANNTSAQATVIRDTAQTLTAATITAGDLDWYTFTLAQAGATSDRVTVHTAGTGLTVQVLNAQQAVVSQASTDAAGLANVSLAGVAAGQYYVKVSGQAADTQAQYDLDVRAAGTAPSTSTSSWTVLVFVNGDNNLEDAAINDLNEMEAALNHAGVNVGVMVDRVGGYDSSNGNWTDTRRGVIVHDTDTSTISSSLTSVGEVDMGNGSALTGFIDWGSQNLSAQRYMVVIWDHGGGALSGSSFDDTSGGHLTNAEVAQAIAASQLGRVDILGFDACLMGAVEIASEMDQVASFLVGSEWTEPGDGWDYTALLTYLQATSTPSELGSAIVDSYGSFYGQGQPLSVTALSGTAAIESAINGFVSVMSAGTATDWQAVATARARAVTADAGLDEYVDIVSFMSELISQSSNATLDAAAQAVVTAVDDAVLRTSGPTSLYGLTVVFPDRGTSLSSAYTAANYDFLADTTWENFVSQYLSRSVPREAATGFQPGAPDFAEFLTLSALSNSLGNDTIDTPFQLGVVNQADYAVTGLNIDSTADADWFTFTMPAGAGYQPTVRVEVLGSVAGVHVQLMDSQGALIAQGTSAAGSATLTFNQASAGGTYLLNVSAPDAAERPAYELHLNAFGTATAVALADFAEAGGGNDSIGKAWQVGGASQLAHYGDIRNLSLDAIDLQGGAAGGDWFRVDSARVTEANVNHVEVVDVSGGAGDLTVKVFDIKGDLVAQSAQPGDLVVTFAAQVDDVFVQVQSSAAQPVLSYGLHLANDPPGGTFNGTAGNDTLTGSVGNDTINGAAGRDTVVFGGDLADYAVYRSGSFVTVSGPEGDDVLVDVERLDFADCHLALDIDGNGGQAYRLYQAAFDRTPDIAGLGFQMNALDAGWGLVQIAQNFIDSPEFSATYGALDNSAFVTQLYLNVLHRAPEPEGLAYHVARLESGVARAGILVGFSESPENQAALIGVIENGMAYTV